MRTRTRLALFGAGCLVAVLAGGLILVGVSGLNRDEQPPLGTATAERAAPADLTYLTESMLIDESVVPPIDGATWGRMVATPMGGAPPVSPVGCGLFLSQAKASQKGLAMRSSNGTAIGVELAITDAPQDLAALVRECRSFTFDGGTTQSRVDLEPLSLQGLPADAIGTLMHCQAGKNGTTIGWDIALITGYRRGVLVSAQYTPGPLGGPFNPALASSLSGIYATQVARLDRV